MNLPTRSPTQFPSYPHLKQPALRNATGITVTGRQGDSALQVFSGLSTALQDYFHAQHGLILLLPAFEPGTSRYELPFYRTGKEEPRLPLPLHTGEFENLESRLRSRARFPLGKVALLPRKPFVSHDFIEDGDYPQTPLEREHNSCSAFFNSFLPGGSGGKTARELRAQEYRDTFFDYISQQRFDFAP